MTIDITTFSSILTIIIIGALGGVSGYILRRMQAFENTKDELRVKVLPSIYAAMSLYTQSIEQFKVENLPLDILKNKFSKIKTVLEKQIFELGAFALLKESKRKNIFKFYLDFSLLSTSVDSYTALDLRSKFKDEAKQTIVGISPKELRELAEQSQKDVLEELNKYNYKLVLIMILIFAMLGALSAIITYLENV